MFRISIIILSIFTLIVAIILNLYKQDLYKYIYFSNNNDIKTVKLFTIEQLQQYNGIKRPELYLSLLGNVFDVTKGLQHYGPEQSYNAFVGRDASRSFITGNFEEKDLTDDVTGLKKQDLLALINWLDFYKKEYTKVGKLVGKYFDSNGKTTQYYKEIKKLVKIAKSENLMEDIAKSQFPPCNVEWSAKQGSRVWCTNRSGGIERSWIGVPRKFYEPGSDSYRCACVNEDDKNSGSVVEYEGCNPELSSCYVKIE